MQTLLQVFHAVSDRTSSRPDGGARYWNKDSMDDLLAKQDWTKLMNHIYDVLDNHRCREAADWIKDKAMEGHVPLLYIFMRNGIKSIGYRVLRSQEFKEWIQTWIMFCFRVVEDTVTCSSVMGLNKAPLTTCLIQKTMGWLAAYEVMEDWPSPITMLQELGFSTVLEEPATLPAEGIATLPAEGIEEGDDVYSEDFEVESSSSHRTKSLIHLTPTSHPKSSPSLSAITRGTPPSPLSLSEPMAFATATWIPGFQVARVGHSVYFHTSNPQAKRACMHNDTHFRVTQQQVRKTFLHQMLKELQDNNSWETWVKTIHQVMVDIPSE